MDKTHRSIDEYVAEIGVSFGVIKRALADAKEHGPMGPRRYWPIW
jgi:hypothetical protein